MMTAMFAAAPMVQMRAREIVDREMDEWAEMAVDGHFDGEQAWSSYHDNLAGPMSRIVGASPEVHVRLTGEDSVRGTFSQRHAVLHDVENGSEYTPLSTSPATRNSCSALTSAPSPGKSPR